MKKYKNIWLSLGSYISSILVGYVIPPLMWSYSSPISQKVANLFIGLSFILIFVGIFFGFRSIIKKESRWVGYIMVILSVLILLLESILNGYAFFGFLYNIGIH